MPEQSATSNEGRHTYQGADAGQLMESILSLVPYDVRGAARVDFQTAIQLAILDDQKERSAQSAIEPRWIPTSQRRGPEFVGSYLVILDGGVPAEATVMCWTGVGGWIYPNGERSDLSVEWWMPIPEIRE